jgi:hypothetical protein
MAEERWYYLQDSRQIGPCSGSELHALLAKGVISPSTLVWTRDIGVWRALQDLSDQPVVRTSPSRLKWIVLGCGIAISGLALVAGGLATGLFVGPNAGNEQALSKEIPQPNQNAPTFAANKFGETNDLRETATNPPPMIYTAPASFPSQAFAPTRVALSREARLEVELWRSIAGSNNADLYEAYLHRYPAGTFADIATAKIEGSQKDTKQDGSADSRTTSKSVTRKATAKALRTTPPPKTTGRCWAGNIQECRERCRNGELRACHILTKFSR